MIREHVPAGRSIAAIILVLLMAFGFVGGLFASLWAGRPASQSLVVRARRRLPR
jgi:hypothetical protein